VDAPVRVDPVVVQPRQAVDVDQQLGVGEAQLQQRHQALAAGQHLRLAPTRLQQGDRLLDRLRRLVAEARRIHAGLLVRCGWGAGTTWRRRAPPMSRRSWRPGAPQWAARPPWMPRPWTPRPWTPRPRAVRAPRPRDRLAAWAARRAVPRRSSWPRR